ncbi:MAG: helix-turn-helix domain-containing protein [Burkholderiales bacterium]
MTEAADIHAIAAAKAGNATPNVRLSQARQAQNLTTAEVARRLKLSVWQVEALESGQYQQLPGAVFVRGFIRNYARLLNLDPEELVHAATGLLTQSMPRPESPPSRDIPFPAAGGWRWGRYAAVAAVIVALLAIYEFLFNDEPGTVTTQPGPIAAVPSSQEPLPAAPSRKPRDAQARQPAAATESSPQVTRAAPVGASAGASQPGERIARPDEREVRLVFEEESWVDIRDRSDQTIFSKLNQAGTTRRVSGVPPLTIVVGNAQGVRMTYAGRDIDLARHTKIDVARLKLE